MTNSHLKAGLLRFVRDYGMVQVLLLLCVYYSIATLKTQYRAGADAGEELARAVEVASKTTRLLAVLQDTREAEALAEVLSRSLEGSGRELTVVHGDPAAARGALQAAIDQGRLPDIIVCTAVTARWTPIAERDRVLPPLANVPVIAPQGYTWPVFLNVRNLLNIPGQIAVISILAAGMTLVILTGGIDLSVGSIVALSAVTATLLIREAGGRDASTVVVVGCCAAAILACALLGFTSGLCVVVFERGRSSSRWRSCRWPAVWPCADAESVDRPGAELRLAGTGGRLRHPAFRGAGGHLRRRTRAADAHDAGPPHLRGWRQRRGGPALRRAGARVALRLHLPAALAALGGIVQFSQLKSAAANYGQNYELNAIAAVAVGGTSLRGGEGSVINTLAGALVLGVINNGMNLTGLSGERQRLILGAVILGAVTFESIKKRGLAAVAKTLTR